MRYTLFAVLHIRVVWGGGVGLALLVVIAGFSTLIIYSLTAKTHLLFSLIAISLSPGRFLSRTILFLPLFFPPTSVDLPLLIRLVERITTKRISARSASLPAPSLLKEFVATVARCVSSPLGQWKRTATRAHDRLWLSSPQDRGQCLRDDLILSLI